MQIESFSEKDTFEFGEKLARNSKPGDIYTLDGDLGCGKTVISKGFASGLGITEVISSPTFTIVQEYTDGDINLYHFDVYRIADPEEMYEIGFDDYLFGDGICLIEWGSMVADILPKNVKRIVISKDLNKGFDYRLITVEGVE